MNILVTIPVNEEHMKKLRAAAPEAEFTIVPQSELTEASVNCKDIIIGNIPHELVKKADSLKWLQLNTAGADGYAAVMPEGVPLTITSGAFGLAISEHMLGMMLMLMKLLTTKEERQRHIKQSSKPTKNRFPCFIKNTTHTITNYLIIRHTARTHKKAKTATKTAIISSGM